MPTLTSIPQDIQLLIVSKVASTSPIAYVNTILTCKSLNFSSKNYAIAEVLNLSPFVKKPRLATNYQDLMDNCLKANNVDAHFVKGMLEYFKSKDESLGLHHLRIASKSNHLQERYVYGVLLIAIGNTEKGGKKINKLTDEYGVSMIEDCIENFQQSMAHNFHHLKDSYMSTIQMMWPALDCHPDEGEDNTVCCNCYHFFLLINFYKMMMGYNDL